MGRIGTLCGLIHSQYKSEAEFARKIGWTRQRMNKITQGKKEPDIYEVNEIAKGLGLSIEEIANIFLVS